MTKHVTFSTQVQVRIIQDAQPPLMIMYDSGADGHYISERDRATARLPILRQSTRLVGVADGNMCRGKHVTKLPI